MFEGSGMAAIILFVSWARGLTSNLNIRAAAVAVLRLLLTSLFYARDRALAQLSGKEENRMLLLTRREGENIMIGDGIQIQVLSVSEETGDVRIQIEAPDAVEAQSRNVDNEVTDRKPGPVITHKRRWRSLVTQ